MSLSFTSRAWVLVAAACFGTVGCATARDSVTVSEATTPVSAGMVDVSTLARDLRVEMRYAGVENFVGDRIDGYQASRCYLHEPVAKALARVQSSLLAQGMSLVVYDCYRPVRAVQHFVRWARDIDDQRNKVRYYPNIDKTRLFQEGYIASQSGHSRGATVDIGLLDCSDRGAGDCAVVDMGAGYDLFDARSHTDSSQVTARQRANRYRLRDALASEGFVNYAKEWWHFTYRPEPTPATAFDFVID